MSHLRFSIGQKALQSSEVVSKKETGPVPDNWRKGRERHILLVHQYQFGNCSVALVVNRPLSKEMCCRSGDKEDSFRKLKK